MLAAAMVHVLPNRLVAVGKVMMVLRCAPC